MKNQISLAIILLFFAISSCFPQSPIRSKNGRLDNHHGLYIESFVQAVNEDEVNITFLVRMDRNLFEFKQGFTQKEQKGVLTALPNLDIEIKDSETIIRTRLNWNNEITKSQDEANQDKYIYATLSTYLKKDNYTAKVTLRDNNRLIKKKEMIINAIDNSAILSDNILFVEKADDTNKFHPCIFDGNLPFEKSGITAYIIAKDLEGWKYRIESIVNESNLMWQREYSYEGEIIKEDANHIRFISNENGKSVANLENSNSNADPTYSIFSIDIPDEAIFPQSFNMYLFNQDTVDLIYRVIWEEKPECLKDINYAIEMMYYILDDEQFSNIKSGNKTEKSQNLLNYWIEQDQTVETPFIENMSLYFHRVDYAQKEYATVRYKDGARTPRGQISILYGKPTSIKNVIVNEQVIEIWKYNHLDKEFTFTVEAPGEYILTEIN